MSADLLAAARVYQARLSGVAVVPARDKRPLAAWGSLAPGVYGTPAQWREATGYAVVPTPASRLAILDIDDATLWPDLLRAAPALGAPDALRTRRGARMHVYLRLPEPLFGVRKLPGQDGREGASLRGVGAIAIGPHSRHPSGDEYRPAGYRPASLDKAQSAALLALFGPETPQSDTMPDGWLSGRLPGVFAQLERAIAQRIGHPLRFSRSGTAPFRAWWRDDKHPSAFFSRVTGAVYDAGLTDKTGKAARVYAFADLCALFGIALAGPDAEPASPRGALIKAGLTRTARLLDTLRDLVGRGPFSRADALAASGLRRQAADTALAQAVSAGLLSRVRRGWYALTDAGRAFLRSAEPLPDAALRGRAVDYRCAVYGQAILDLRSTSVARPPSSRQIAARAGVSRATGYRYERKLGIARVKVLHRAPIPRPYEYNAFLLSQKGEKIPLRIDVVRSDGVSIGRYLCAGDGSEAFTSARLHAQRARAYLYAVEQWPSIRIFPGERLEDLLPAGAVLDSGGYVVVTQLLHFVPQLSARARGRAGSGAGGAAGSG